MGSSMGMVQDAYRGLRKQNYTMLDNLKLGMEEPEKKCSGWSMIPELQNKNLPI
jgi:hypothetical protein